VNVDNIKSFIHPTNAHTNYFITVKLLKTFKVKTLAATCFGLHKPSSGRSRSVLRQIYNIDFSYIYSAECTQYIRITELNKTRSHTTENLMNDSPCDFFLSPKLKFHFKGRHFGTVVNIQKVVTDQLRALLHEDFQHCNVSGGVWLPKGTTLKGIMLIYR